MCASPVTVGSTCGSNADMFYTIKAVNIIEFPHYYAESGDLTVIQGLNHAPFEIARVFVVRAPVDTIRGQHAHKVCMQLLMCPIGSVEVRCDDGRETTTHILDKPNVGLLVPPSIWAQQTYLVPGSVLIVLCDRRYEPHDYIRDYDEFKVYRASDGNSKFGENMEANDPIRLNLGCGGRPLRGYINVDIDSLDQIRARYPNQTFDEDLVVVRHDIFNLPYATDSVDEIRSEGLIEHLPFIDEPRFFNEIVRILKPGGLLYLSTVDFEMAAKQWLAAEDDWKDFYRNDRGAILNQHWFGTYTYEPTNRWGYLTATIYGSQNGAGQFHTNCYSEAKLRAICKKMKLNVESIKRFQWKDNRDHMLGLTATKI